VIFWLEIQNTIYSGYWSKVHTQVVNICTTAGNYSLIKALQNVLKKHQGLRDTSNRKTEEYKIKCTKLAFSNDLAAQILHNFAHNYREIVCEIYYDLKSSNFTNREGIAIKFTKFISSTLANIKQIFDHLTDDNCSVCIKLVDIENGEYRIRTFERDHGSARKRSDIDKRLPNFPHHQNTAFYVIFDPNCEDSHFLCNDLKNKERYFNCNINWRDYYNACLVVPIRLITERDSKEERSSVLGFICVDNFKGNFTETANNILATMADSCFYLFSIFFHYTQSAKANN
jgi:hypothetical protein